MASSEVRTVLLVTKIDRAAIDKEISEHGAALVEPPQTDDCEVRAVQGDYVYWAADIEIEVEED